MKYRSLSNTSFDELFEAFQQAFADYEIQLDKGEHWAMLKRRGFNPELSLPLLMKTRSCRLPATALVISTEH